MKLTHIGKVTPILGNPRYSNTVLFSPQFPGCSLFPSLYKCASESMWENAYYEKIIHGLLILSTKITYLLIPCSYKLFEVPFSTTNFLGVRVRNIFFKKT